MSYKFVPTRPGFYNYTDPLGKTFVTEVYKIGSELFTRLNGNASFNVAYAHGTWDRTPVSVATINFSVNQCKDRLKYFQILQEFIENDGKQAMYAFENLAKKFYMIESLEFVISGVTHLLEIRMEGDAYQKADLSIFRKKIEKSRLLKPYFIDLSITETDVVFRVKPENLKINLGEHPWTYL